MSSQWLESLLDPVAHQQEHHKSAVSTGRYLGFSSTTDVLLILVHLLRRCSRKLRPVETTLGWFMLQTIKKASGLRFHAQFQPTYGISMGFSISLCPFRAATPSHSAVRSEFFCTTVTVVVPGCVAKLA